VGYLFQDVGGNVVHLLHVVEVRVLSRYREYLVVLLSVVHHLHQGDGTRLYRAAGEGGLVHQDHDIHRVVIVVEGLRDETVVSRVVHRGVEHPVENVGVHVLLVLVLVLAPLRYLYDRPYHLRDVRPRRQVLPVVVHVL